MSGKIFWSRKIGESKIHPRSRELEKKKIVLTKRRKFIIVSLVLLVGLYVVQRLSVENRYPAILGLAAMSYIISGWSLLTDLRGIAWLTNLILPVLYPSSVALFYFLLPQSLLTRFVVLIIFAISMYGLMLTANIFSVASIRTIQLLRAARTVGFLLSVLTSAFLLHVVFSFNLPVWTVAILTFFIGLAVFIQGIWSYSLGTSLTKEEMRPVIIGSTLLTETAVVLCFYLIDAPLASIVLAMTVYVLLGIFQNNMEKRLFARTAQEYLGFALIVLLVAVFATLKRWMT